MSPTETDDLAARLTPEALRQQLDWHKERIASKPWFKDGILDKPEASISCHFMVALIEKALGADALDRRPEPKVGMIGHVDSGKTSLAAAVTRALAASPSPALEAVAVKPLEWNPETGLGFHYADTPFGSYTIMSDRARFKSVKWWFGANQSVSTTASSVAEARVAIQADYETLIRSALTHPPALVEALKRARARMERIASSRLTDMNTMHPDMAPRVAQEAIDILDAAIAGVRP